MSKNNLPQVIPNDQLTISSPEKKMPNQTNGQADQISEIHENFMQTLLQTSRLADEDLPEGRAVTLEIAYDIIPKIKVTISRH